MGLSIHKLQYFGKNKKKRRVVIMKIRTDLAMEAESFTTATGKLQGIKVTEKKEDDITITRMDILNHTGEEIIGKTMGTYITIDAPMLSDFDDDYHEKYRLS